MCFPIFAYYIISSTEVNGVIDIVIHIETKNKILCFIVLIAIQFLD